MSNITSKIEELVTPILQELTLELVEIEYRKRRSRLVFACIYRYTIWWY